MRCINFDEQFERFATQWMRQNEAKFKNNVDAMEREMPNVYLQWLNEPADWLDGVAPGAYFARFDDPSALTAMLCDYIRAGVPVPDQLLERLTALGEEAKRALLALLDDAQTPQEAVLTAISLLGEMEAIEPMARYIAWIAERQAHDDRADMAAEALTAMGVRVVEPILRAVEGANPAGKETFLDVLCNFPGDERILSLGLALLHAGKDKLALYASMLGKLGDPRALPALQAALDWPEMNYLDFVELRNAIEELGGDTPAEREFAGDPYYESLRRME